MNSYMLRRTKKIHFVGIGGIGMSGIAEFLHNKGFDITGSDITDSDITKHLQNEGIKIFLAHNKENIIGVDTVVKSSAVKDDNPEVAHALAQKITVIRRAEMLAELIRMSFGIGIAGTHGKTTSTSMVGMILSAANLDPTVIVGGRVMNYGKNNLLGSGEYIVVEADEYDRSFLTLSPIIAAITNIEADHLDCYNSLDDIKNAFITYANKVPFFGSVICCLDDPGVQSILPDIKKNIVTYGITRQADVKAINIKYQNFKTTFEVLFKDYNLGDITLNTIGKHNIQNALLAIAIGIEINIPFDKIKKGLQDFKGVYRRMELIGEIQPTPTSHQLESTSQQLKSTSQQLKSTSQQLKSTSQQLESTSHQLESTSHQLKSIIVYDDYAHHPTEIQTTLQGLRDNTENRIVAVFQPHLYSRTRDFADDFGRSFYNADILIITPIYKARENPIDGINAKLIAEKAIQAGHHNVIYVENNEEITKTIRENMKPGDIIITIGAGDIYKYGRELINEV